MQHVKHPEAPADGRLAVLERVPGKTHARLEVLLRGIQEIRISRERTGEGARQHTKVRELAVNLRNQGRRFVTQTPT